MIRRLLDSGSETRKSLRQNGRKMDLEADLVALQNSLKEGFGLTEAEAMWKGKQEIGGFVGGIPAQIVCGRTGFTVNSDAARQISG